MSKRVYEEDDPPVEGNSLRAKKDDLYIWLGNLQQEAAFTRSIPLRQATEPYTQYDDLLARSYCCSFYPYGPNNMGFNPSIRIQRIELEGNVHWSDDGWHTQTFEFSQSGALQSPMVFLALIYDNGDPEYYLPGSASELALPYLPPEKALNMFFVSKGYPYPYPQDEQPNPFPAPSVNDRVAQKYTVLWNKSFILPSDPEHTYENIREEQDPPYPAPPLEFKREFRWIPRTRYFKVSLDVDLPIVFNRAPLEADQIAGKWLCGSRGNIFMLSWWVGGMSSGTSSGPQTVYLNHVVREFFDLNKS